MPRRVSAAVFLVLAVAGAAGCGGSDRAEYERELAKVGRSIDSALGRLPADETSTMEPEQVATLADDLREAAEQLEDIDPPTDAAEPHRRLERGLRGVAEAFDDLARDLRTAEDDDERAEMFVEFATDADAERAFDDVSGAQEEFAREGYRVFAPERPARKKS